MLLFRQHLLLCYFSITQIFNSSNIVLFRPIKQPNRVLNLDHVIDSRARTQQQQETVEVSTVDQEAQLRAEQEEKEKQRKQEEAR